jgi:uncharacterized protein YaaN involved in tellurite resistance
MGDSLEIGRKAAPAARATGIVAAADEAPAAPTPAGDASASGGSAPALVPPASVALVEDHQATGAVKLDRATLARLDVMVADYVVAISKLDTSDPRFQARIDDIQKLGDDEVKASASVSSRLLDRPVGSMRKGGLASGSTVGTGLLQLRRQIDQLDPGRQGDLFGPRKLLGVIPFGDRLSAYFARYQSSQSHINAIFRGLENGQAELGRDNEDLEREKASLWQTMERLREYIYLAQKLDSSLTERIAKIEAADPERARILKEDMLFYVRQKVQDLTAQLAVSVQGYLTLDVIRRNNLELIRGVDRATTTTISALRTAVIVAGALGDQKLVLDQITALNTTTSNMIESTSALLRQQSTAINQGSAAPTIDLGKLQAAFDNVYATMDEIDAYKLKALETMNQTVGALTMQINKAQSHVDRARASELPAGTGSNGNSAGPK